MMDANEVIRAYTNDVAGRLPRALRNDVAFELQALLTEELEAKAGDAGRPADAAMALELLNAFGHPAEVAARYGAPLTIIDPADSRSFVKATAIGLAAIWALGLVTQNHLPITSGGDFLKVLGHWWTGTAVPSLWWPGVLVTGFGLASWARRRWPKISRWKPREDDQISGGRATLVIGIAAIACGLYVLVEPGWVLDVIWNGRAAPAAYQALTYTDLFRQRQGPVLFALLLLNIPLLVAITVSGRRSATLRRFEMGLSLATCAAMVWTVLDGPVLMTPTSDHTVKFMMVLITAVTLLQWAIKLHRRLKSAPKSPIHAWR